MVAPKPQPPRIRNPRTARTATAARIAHNSRSRYGAIVRVSLGLGGVLAMLLCYVTLTSNLTGLTYAVAKAESQREHLQEGNLRLEDRIAALTSDDRLAAIAARYGMVPPKHFAMVTIAAPAAVAPPAHFAFLSSLAGLLMPAAARGR